MARSEIGFGFLVSQVMPQRTTMVLAMVLLLGQSGASLVVPRLAGKFANALLAAAEPGKILVLWLGVVAIQSLLNFASGYLLARAAAEILARLSERLYDHLQALPLAWFQDRKRGEVLALLTNDIQRISTFVTETLVRLLPQLVTFFGALTLIYLVDPTIAGTVFVVLPLFFLLLKIAIRGLRPLSDRLVRSQAGQVAIVEENLGVLPVIKSFVTERLESERFRGQTRLLLSLQKRYLLTIQLLTPATRFLLTATLVGVLWLSVEKVTTGVMAPGDLVSLLLYGMLMSLPLANLANIYGEIQTARGAATRLLEAFGEQPEPYQEDKPPLPLVQGEIRFEGIEFRYPGREPLLTGVDLSLRKGETVAVTGSNGTGKSTLAYMLMRLIEPQRGRITIDGIDIAEIQLVSLRRQIGLVDQNTLLLNGTVADNIAYGRADVDFERLEKAVRAAHAQEFIAALPEGYETLVGDQGVKLSGGQKQRIALARALLKDPAILIMDEATSMFDPDGERAFIRECHEVLRSRTVILITHRPESLKLADRVVRLEAGRLLDVSR